ncbi:MAG: serine/threonine protein kinase [Planctomycetes bacterium]|nr:serine/threonine protein kinase [Planctomycetota bacterium]
MIALVGEGGMGQVYLADDLVLGQPVALKFLPPHLAERDGGLERFRAEVRHAREVTHPNVARVHDIGEVQGRHFLSMEFVDGEDLASLIRRIGRLPREKAAEIGQQICAGLAEAHRRGVLHRDLKPANVMLDGEGRVKLTDFGLAVSAQASSSSALAGTPQYMAPEQLSGLPADERSEVYSLGLVLYELYTGHRALRGRTVEELRREHEEGPPSPPSSVQGEVEPLVDAMLTRCLARDPLQRPASVLEVARGMPGGDPLAAALARGQTPAPEIVAAAEVKGRLSPRTALLLAVGSILLFVGFAFGRTWYLDRLGVSYGKAPAVLDERTRELFTQLTGEPAPEFEVHWYALENKFLPADVGGNEGAPALGLQALLRHTRIAAQAFAPAGGFVSVFDPMPSAGTAHVVLDAGGKLVSWTHWPTSMGKAAPGSEVDWSRLFALAGLDMQSAVAIDPEFVPRANATERRAWKLGDGSWRVQGAALDGRAVQFELLDKERSVGWPPAPTGDGTAWVILGLTAIAAVVAWRNLRQKRAYLSGALVVGGFAMATHLVLVFDGVIPADPQGFGTSLFLVVAISAGTALRVFLFFLALEPFARRHWPGALISWTRLLEGRFQDPAVGREVLVGVFSGLSATLVILLVGAGLAALGLQPWVAGPLLGITGISSPIQTLFQVVHFWGDTVMYGGIILALLVATRTLVRRAWLGNVIWLALTVLLFGGWKFEDPATIAATVGVLVSYLFLLTRFGFMAVLAFMGVLGTLTSQGLTLRPGDWYFASGLISLLVFGLLVFWGYRASLSGRAAVR